VQCPCCKTGKMITILFFRANAPQSHRLPWLVSAIQIP
jgi:hypothetical protein